MFMDIGCPPGWPAGGGTRAASVGAGRAAAATDGQVRLVLELIENRSTLPESARGTVAAMLMFAVACTIGPAMRGQVFVPVAVITCMAMLWLALEWFQRAPVPRETLIIDAAHVRFDDHRGRQVEWPTFWTRLEIVERSALDRRLFLRLRDQCLEIGRCIDAHERGLIAPRITAALAAKGHAA